MQESETEVLRINIIKYMEAHGYSVRSFAAETGISYSNIQRYVTGENDIPIRNILKIAKTMGVSVDWLLGLSESRQGSLTDETKELVDLYSIATEDDKTVIKTILNKYKTNTFYRGQQ